MARHLIHIGYPKAGSTFLQAWFEHHPEFRYAPGGGVGGYYSIFEISRPPSRIPKYFVTSYEGLCTPHKDAGRVRTDLGRETQVRGEPIKQDQKKVCSVLSALYPGSLILIVTRGFKSMIMSGYSQYVRSGGVLRLDQLYKYNHNAPAPERPEADENNHYDFDYLIRLYSESFGRENLIILPYEFLRDNQPGFLAVLEGKLGIEHFEHNFGRLNASLSSEELYWYRVISSWVAPFTLRLGDSLFEKIYRRYIDITMENKMRGVVEVLRRLMPDRRITDADFPTGLLHSFRGKATLLKDDPLYAPYVKEYLWD